VFSASVVLSCFLHIAFSFLRGVFQISHRIALGDSHHALYAIASIYRASALLAANVPILLEVFVL